MRAIEITKYGSADYLALKEVDKPAPGGDQVLVKVVAASANPADYHTMMGGIALVVGKLLKIPENRRMGRDYAGVVEAAGNEVTGLKAGDAVFGATVGSFADYLVTRAANAVPKPANVSFEQAAAVPVAAITALQGLRDSGHLQAGQSVLINGASGGVGSSAVQIALAYGARVDGVCSTRNIDLVRSLGVERVYDYTREDFTRSDVRYDLIYDAVGNRAVADLRRIMAPHGRSVLTGFGGMYRLLESFVMGKLLSKADGQTIQRQAVASVNGKDLAVLADLMARGKLALPIDRRYDLSESADAMRYLGQGHARGKVIVTVGQAGN